MSVRADQQPARGIEPGLVLRQQAGGPGSRYRTSASDETRRDLYIVNADGSNGHWARLTDL